MIDYGELVLTRTPATVTIDTDQLPEWTLMPLSLLRDAEAVSLHDDGYHVVVGTEWTAPVYLIVGWDHHRSALILRRHDPGEILACDPVDPADIPPVEDEEITKP